MNLPFTFEQFLKVFSDYNSSVWPMQCIFYLLSLVMIVLAFWKTRFSDLFINILLSMFWLWMGIVYHLLFFTVINKAAYAFGALFIIQGLLFLYYAIVGHTLSYNAKFGLNYVLGYLFILYGLFIYPAIGYLLGHHFPSSPTFGLPCPTVIFTFGLLLFTDKKLPVFILIIPLLWSFIGFTAALKLGIWQDTGLLITGLAAGFLLIFRAKRGENDLNAALH